MYEVDFLKAGEKKDADAICLRFDRPDGGGRAVVVIDAGWQQDGPNVVDFVKETYGTNQVDLAVVTHPDGDHIGGMGEVIRELDVARLAIHRLDQRGGSGLEAAGAVQELVQVAEERGTAVEEPFQGRQYFGDALTVLGPSEAYYAALLDEQRVRETEKKGVSSSLLSSLAEATRSFADRFLDSLPMEEIPFGEGPGPGPRNNSATVMLFAVDDFRALLTADAGVPAIMAALEFADSENLEAIQPDLVQIPHHGSRRNASSEMLDRLLGAIGHEGVGKAYVSVCGKEDPKHPNGRVINAYVRRGYSWQWTAGQSIWRHSSDAPMRWNYVPLEKMPPLEEPDEEE